MKFVGIFAKEFRIRNGSQEGLISVINACCILWWALWFHLPFSFIVPLPLCIVVSPVYCIRDCKWKNFISESCLKFPWWFPFHTHLFHLFGIDFQNYQDFTNTQWYVAHWPAPSGGFAFFFWLTFIHLNLIHMDIFHGFTAISGLAIDERCTHFIALRHLQDIKC